SDLLPAAQDGHTDRVARLMPVHNGADVLRVGDLLAVDGNDQIAAQHDGRMATYACWLPPRRPARSAAPPGSTRWISTPSSAARPICAARSGPIAYETMPSEGRFTRP